MPTYRFTQFQIDIDNPTVEIDLTRIVINDILKTVDVNIKLTTQDARVRAVTLSNMPFTGDWHNIDLPTLVDDKLSEFEI